MSRFFDWNANFASEICRISKKFGFKSSFSAFFRGKTGYTKGGLISSMEKNKQANYTKMSRFFDWNANFASEICRISKKFGFKRSFRTFFRGKTGYTKGGLISSRENNKQSNYRKMSRFFDWNANFASEICRISKKFGFKSSFSAFFRGKTGYTKGGLISSREKNKHANYTKMSRFLYWNANFASEICRISKKFGFKSSFSAFFRGKTGYTKGGLISSREKNKQAIYTKMSRFFDWNANFASEICRISKKFGFKSSFRAFFRGKTGYTNGGLISSREKNKEANYRIIFAIIRL